MLLLVRLIRQRQPCNAFLELAGHVLCVYEVGLWKVLRKNGSQRETEQGSQIVQQTHILCSVPPLTPLHSSPPVMTRMQLEKSTKHYTIALLLCFCSFPSCVGMKSIATVLALAALSASALAEPAQPADSLKSSLLRFEAWSAKNTGVSVFAWSPLQGAIAQANVLPDSEVRYQCWSVACSQTPSIQQSADFYRCFKYYCCL